MREDQSSYSEQYQVIPEDTWRALVRYVNHRIGTGDFLRAVVEDSLNRALAHAAGPNRDLRVLDALAKFLYNQAPSDCWGSREKVTAWVTHRCEEQPGV